MVKTIHDEFLLRRPQGNKNHIRTAVADLVQDLFFGVKIAAPPADDIYGKFFFEFVFICEELC